MNGDRAMAKSLCADIARGVDQIGQIDKIGEVEILLCPPHILIPPVVDALADTPIGVGAQDLDANENGAFTGQISAAMIADSGCRHVIIGHSERRTLYGETSELTARKTRTALAAGLNAIVCLGETLAERQAGATEEVIGRQLAAILDSVDGGAAAFAESIIAYEPVWAIGTGATATPEQAQQVHRFIRARLAERDARAAGQCRILYGGSMKPQNAAELLAQSDIDGGLIGGAALNSADFLAICQAAAAAAAPKSQPTETRVTAQC